MDTRKKTKIQAKNPTLDHQNVPDPAILVLPATGPTGSGTRMRALRHPSWSHGFWLVRSRLRRPCAVLHPSSMGREVGVAEHDPPRMLGCGVGLPAPRRQDHDGPVQLQWRWGGACTRGPTAESMRLASAVSPFHATGRPQCPQWGGSSGCHGSGSFWRHLVTPSRSNAQSRESNAHAPQCQAKVAREKVAKRFESSRRERGWGVARAPAYETARARLQTHAAPPKPPRPPRHRHSAKRNCRSPRGHGPRTPPYVGFVSLTRVTPRPKPGLRWRASARAHTSHLVVLALGPGGPA